MFYVCFLYICGEDTIVEEKATPAAGVIQVPEPEDDVGSVGTDAREVDA